MSPGLRTESIVVVDLLPGAAGDANAAGLVAVTGDGTRRDVLGRAEIRSARQVVIAVNRDDTAVLIALAARQLNPCVTILAAVREEENQDLLRLSGADQVVVSSGTAGQLLAISAARPAVGRVIAGLLDRGRGLDLVERPVAAAEVGTPARDADGTVIALLRGDDLLPARPPRCTPARPGRPSHRGQLPSTAQHRPRHHRAEGVHSCQPSPLAEC